MSNMTRTADKEKTVKYQEGMRVKALKIITDGGPGSEPDPEATVLKGNPGFVHALVNDEGVVEYVDSDGCPTVRFDGKGTATIVGDSEIKVIGV